MKLLRNRRGISLAEAVIAMAVILVVSAAATTLITHFAAVSARMMQRNEATNIVENTLECFKYCDNRTDFEAEVSALGYAYGVAGDVYTLEGNDYVIRLEVGYGAESATFAASVSDKKGRGILEIEPYTRYY